MISLLNAVLPHGEALLIWLLDTLCRMHKGLKLANTFTSPKPQGSKKSKTKHKNAKAFCTYLLIYLFT